MNVVFISISPMPNMKEHSISLDLIREFVRNGHNMYVICSNEKKSNLPTSLTKEEGCHVLRVKIGNNKKAGLIEKGLTTLMLPYQYISAVKKYLSNVKFDLVLYPTPPVTHLKTVKYIKKRDNAKTYLLLKDIFPQNAVDIEMMSKTGFKSVIYKYFRYVEKQLYKVSDRIGCMSQANVDYILKHNPEIDARKVEICPNSIEVVDKRISQEDRKYIRQKYDIPLDKKVFVYGGNLGKPQGIPFIVECLKKVKDIHGAYFLIVGDGTEYKVLEKYYNESKQKNFRLMKKLPKEDYDQMVAACNVGLIFLDYRFTIPNFPSRLLGYMQAGLPVLACTDPNTDIGKVIVDGKFGWWCESDDADRFSEIILSIIKKNAILDEKSFSYLKEMYSIKKAYEIIMEQEGEEM